MSTPNWEDIDVPRGAYIGWGNTPGQHVTGRVVEYSLDAGRDFYDQPCPQLAVELTETAASFNKAGERHDFDAGELVQLSAGQVSLKRALRAADPSPGDLVKITLVNIEPLKGGKTVKEFGIKIARGAAPAAPKAAVAAGFGGSGGFGGSNEEPPF